MIQQQKAAAFREEVILWGVIAVSLVLFISNFGIGGRLGNSLSSFFFGMFGLVAYIFPIVLFAGSFFGVSNKDNPFAILKLIAAILFFIFICLFSELIVSKSVVMTPKEAFQYSSSRKAGGGIVGGCLAYILVPAFGIIGAYIIDIIVLIITMVLITERSALKGVQKGSRKVYETARENTER